MYHKMKYIYPFILSVILIFGINACSDNSGNPDSSKKIAENGNSLIGDWGVNCVKEEERILKVIAEIPGYSSKYPNYINQLKEHNKLIKFEISKTKLKISAPDVIYYEPSSSEYKEKDRERKVRLILEYPYSIRKEIGNSVFDIEYSNNGVPFQTTMTIDGDNLEIDKDSVLFSDRKNCTWIRM